MVPCEFPIHSLHRSDASQQITPIPTDLIELWKDYECLDYFFAHLPDKPWRKLNDSPVWEGKEALSSSSELLRMFHAAHILETDTVFIIKRLLGLTWKETRAVVCPLRDVISEKHLPSFYIFMLGQAQCCDWAAENKELAHQCIQGLKDIESGKLNCDAWAWYVKQIWIFLES
jgi:hypothetical protein